MDVILWTLFGLIASIYGRPIKIADYAFLANLLGVFVGDSVGVQILAKMDSAYLVSAIFSVSVIFISLILMHFLTQAIEKDIIHGFSQSKPQTIPSNKEDSLSLYLPKSELLSPRKREIGGY